VQHWGFMSLMMVECHAGFELLMWDDMWDPVGVKLDDTWDGVKVVNDGG
jgi:hypothetical protein